MTSFEATIVNHSLPKRKDYINGNEFELLLR